MGRGMHGRARIWGLQVVTTVQFKVMNQFCFILGTLLFHHHVYTVAALE